MGSDRPQNLGRGAIVVVEQEHGAGCRGIDRLDRLRCSRIDEEVGDPLLGEKRGERSKRESSAASARPEQQNRLRAGDSVQQQPWSILDMRVRCVLHEPPSAFENGFRMLCIIPRFQH